MTQLNLGFGLQLGLTDSHKDTEFLQGLSAWHEEVKPKLHIILIKHSVKIYSIFRFPHTMRFKSTKPVWQQ